MTDDLLETEAEVLDVGRVALIGLTVLVPMYVAMLAFTVTAGLVDTIWGWVLVAVATGVVVGASVRFTKNLWELTKVAARTHRAIQEQQ